MLQEVVKLGEKNVFLLTINHSSFIVKEYALLSKESKESKESKGYKSLVTIKPVRLYV
jgi:hypothetical protein